MQEIDAQLGPKSHTSANKRTEELKKIFWDFLLFKQRLETQKQSYYLEVYSPGTPFDKGSLSSLSGLTDPDSVVEYTIFPALHGVKSNNPFVAQKARVKLLSPGEQPKTFEERAEDPNEWFFGVRFKKLLEQPWGETDKGHTKGLLETILSMIPKDSLNKPLETPSEDPDVEEL